MTAALAPTGYHCSHAAPTGASKGENSWARIWHSFLIFAAFVLLGAEAWRSVLASWLVTGVLLVAAGPAVGRRRVRRRCRHRSPTSARTGLRTGLTWANGWQVQDSNLGRLSSAILQTVAGTALTWANVRAMRHFGTYLT